MDPVKPSRLANIQELTALLGLSVQIQGEIAQLLEEFHNRIYALEQDRNRILADNRALQSRCTSLEKRYSELLYKFSEFKKDC